MSIFSNAYSTEQKVQAVFIGLLGRNAKTAGLDHYVAAIDNTTNNYGIAEMLSELVNTQPEYINAVSGMGRASIVEYVFLNLFGRAPTFDSEGNNYWVNGAGAAVPVDLLVTAIIDGASAQDQLALEKKVAVAIYMENNPGLTDAQAKAILGGMNASSVVADVQASVAATIAENNNPVGQEYILEAIQDDLTGTAKADTFKATQDTLQTGDEVDGAGGNDTLVVSIQGSNDFFATPILTSIETVRVNAPNFKGQYIELDLSNSDSYNTLESFQTTSYWGQGYASLWFYDIQNVNNTDIRIIDTNLDHYFSYDTNAYESFGGNDDAVDLYLSEVDGSYIEFYNEGTNDWSNVDRVNLTSAQRVQTNTTTFNYVYALEVGGDFNELYIDGDADLEIEEVVNGWNNGDNNLNYVDATGLDANLWLDLEAQGLDDDFTLTVLGAQQNDNIDIYGDGNNTVELFTGEDNLHIHGDGFNYVDLGDDDDYLHIEGDVVGGVSTVIAGEGNDSVEIDGGEDNSGNYDIDLGNGDDYLSMYIDGQQTIDAGEGNDYVQIVGDGYHDIDLGDGNDDLYIYGAGINTNSTRTSIDGGDGDDYVYISENHRLTVDLGEGNDELDIRADDLSSTDIITGNDGIDTITLRNAGGDIPAGRVTASETDNTSSIEVFRLLDENILLELDDNLFETAQDNTITVDTSDADGTSTVDITRVNTNSYQFNLVGGAAVKQDIVIANDETIDSFSSMDFGGGTNDILRVIDGATLTEEDLEGISGLEIIELVSDSNSPQEWRIDLNDAIINQTTGDPDPLVIRIDHRVPHGSVLYIDTSAVVGANDGVIIERSANVTVIVDGVDVNDPGFVAPGWMIVNTRLIFTDGNDSLIGTDGADHFYAYDPSHVNGGADFIDGNNGHDTVHFDYSLENQNQTIGNQLNGLLWQEIEELSFNEPGDIKVNRVRAEGLGAELAQVTNITTGNGNDDLRNMAHGKVWDLNSGNDILDFDNAGGTSFIEGGAGIDIVTGGDYGDTLWLSNVESVASGGGNDVINYNYGNGNNGNNGNITVDGGAGNDSLILDQNGTNGLALVSFVETITGGSGADTISASNTQDMTINGGSGNDTITVTSGVDVSVNGGSNDDLIVVTVSSDASVDGGTGNDTITISAGDDVTVNGGSGNDSITVTYGTGVGGTDDAIVNGDAGNDTITIIEGVGADGATVNGGLGQDTINLFLSATGDNDTVVLGNIVYTALQQVDTGSTTQNYAPQAIPGQAVVTGYNDGKDIINNFNFEDAGGAGQDDVLNFDAFLTGQTLGVNDYNDQLLNPGGISVGAIEYGNWTGGVNAVDMDRGVLADTDAAVAIIAANNGFVLNASHITTTGGAAGIELDNGQRAVVLIAKDTNGDSNFDQVDVYFVQDVDGGPGSAWAVDLVATVNSATEIGAITSINLSNMTW